MRMETRMDWVDFMVSLTKDELLKDGLFDREHFMDFVSTEKPRKYPHYRLFDTEDFEIVAMEVSKKLIGIGVLDSMKIRAMIERIDIDSAVDWQEKQTKRRSL